MMNMKKIFVLFVVLLLFSFGCIGNEKQIEDINKYPQIKNGKEISFEKVCFVDNIHSTEINTKTYILNNQSDLGDFTSVVKQKCANVDFAK